MDSDFFNREEKKKCKNVQRSLNILKKAWRIIPEDPHRDERAAQRAQTE